MDKLDNDEMWTKEGHQNTLYLITYFEIFNIYNINIIIFNI